MTEFVNNLIEANVAAGAGVLAVLATRWPARRLFGPEVAYRLWALPVLAAAATLIPAREEAGAPVAGAAAAMADWTGFVAPVWLAGAFAVAAMFAYAQARFLQDVKAGKAGPAVVGVVAPRLVMPTDDGTYTPEERALIRAHEREHIARMDPRSGALAAALQCLFWFNPLVHLAAHLVRLDQELACDAAVVNKHRGKKALYARTLLKTQIASQPLPFGCYWPARGAHPLEVRVALLKGPRRGEGLTGPVVVTGAAVMAACLAWFAQPPVAPKPQPVYAWDQQPSHPATSVLLITIRPKTAP